MAQKDMAQNAPVVNNFLTIDPLAWAADGIPVFPVQPDKTPYPGFLWKDLASTDPEQVKRWQEQYPGCMWAFSPGMVGWCVVDLDVKGGKDGIAAWADISGPISVYNVTTPSGGRHHYFRGHLRQSVSKLGPGIDTKGDDGYVLIYSAEPPEPYRLPVIPQSIVDKVGEKPEAKTAAPGVELDTEANIAAAISFLSHRAPAVEGEGGDDWTYQTAERLRDIGVSLDRAHTLMLAHWNERCVPPWDEDALRVKIENAWSYGQNEAGCMAPTDGAELKANALALEAKRERKEAKGEASTVRVRRGKYTIAKRHDWLWRGWLARGKLEMIGGRKGDGKSTVIITLFAGLTVGKLPDGSTIEPVDVLIWSAEDDWEDTVFPRFLAAGGDPERVDFIEGSRDADGNAVPFDPAYDMPKVRNYLAAHPNVAAFMIDPIVSAVAGDGHRNNDVRRGLQPVVDLAQRCRLVAIGITHFTKGTVGRDVVERFTGSLAFGALSRLLMGTAAKAGDEWRRLIRVASNIGSSGGGFKYRLIQKPVPGYDDDFIAQVAEWGAVLDGDAQQLIDEMAPDKPEKTDDGVTQVAMWLKKFLSPYSRGCPTIDVFAAARAYLGYGERTVFKAKATLGALIETVAGDKPGDYRWRISDEF